MFKQDKQFNLIPQNYRSFLWESHEVIIFEEIINELDLTELIASYSNFSRWTSAYHPRMLLKVLFYWYMNQTFSSRKLAKKLKSDLAFMYLAWNNKPNFRTINGFRKNKGEMLEWIFIQIVLKAKELWLISFWTASLDGTKVYANASKNKNNDLEWLDKKISKLFDEADKIDKLEDNQYGDNQDQIPEELKTKEGREKKKKEIAEKKKKLEDKKLEVTKEIQAKKDNWINQTRINDTDKDSRLMMMKRKDWWNGYNPQNTTEKQFIISTTVPNSANDTNELIPAIEKIEKQYWILPDKILADKWYGTEENYNYWKQKNIITYIPHPKYSGAHLDDYKYETENDTYEDNEWNIFKCKQFVWSVTGRSRWRPKKDEIIKEEDFEAKLYFTTWENWKKRYLQIAKNLKNIFKENDDRLYSEEWKEIYKKRSWCVENVFWNIKMNLKFERFSLRWFQGVQIEWTLISLAHNLGKIMKFKTI
jgi:transposase